MRVSVYLSVAYSGEVDRPFPPRDGAHIQCPLLAGSRSNAVLLKRVIPRSFSTLKTFLDSVIPGYFSVRFGYILIGDSLVGLDIISLKIGGYRVFRGNKE